MQFIFGDNRSRYDLLYTDDVREEASRVLDLIRLPFEPDETFDIYGYLPFGKNSNRPLYFRTKKDTKLSRNVYFLHGFYRELDTEYFFSSDYSRDMFTSFIEQDGFDALRDDPDSFSYDVTYDSSLDALDLDELDITRAQLVRILEQLYSKNKVVILLDDARFEPVYTRLLMKKLFKYMPPSLRKICSYIIGMLDTGSMNFMITVIPKSVYKKTAAVCVDLTADDAESGSTSVFATFIERALIMSDAEREEIFSFFELACYGRNTTYQKQKFADFYTALTNNDYETMMSDFVESNYYTDETVIPTQISSVLKPHYDSEEYLQAVLSTEEFEIGDPIRYYEENSTTIIKLSALSDPQLDYLKAAISSAYSVRITMDNVVELKDACEAFKENRPQEEDLESRVESRYLEIVGECVASLEARIAAYYKMLEESRVLGFCASILDKHVDTPLPEEFRNDWILKIVEGVLANEKCSLFVERNNIDIAKPLALAIKAVFDEHDRAARETIKRREEEAIAAAAAAELAAIEAQLGELEDKLQEAYDMVKERRDNNEPDAETNDAQLLYREQLARSMELDERFAARRARCFAKHIEISTLSDESYLENMYADSLLSEYIAADSEAFDVIINELTAKKDMEYVVAALMFIITYSQAPEAMLEAVANTTLDNLEHFEALKKPDVAQIVGYLGAALDQKLLKFSELEDISLELCDAATMKLEAQKMSNGFNKKLAQTLNGFVDRLAPDDGEAPKIKKNTLLIMMIGAGVILVLVLSILIITLFGQGKDNDTPDGSDTTVAIVEDNTTGVDGDITDGDATTSA